MATTGIGIKIPYALDAALQRAFPQTAAHGFVEYRAHQAILAFLRHRGIDITAEIAASTSKRTPARTNRAAPVRKRRTVRSMRRRRRSRR